MRGCPRGRLALKKFILLVVVACFGFGLAAAVDRCSSGSSPDKLITEEMTRGAAWTEPIDIEVQEDKDVHGGTYVQVNLRSSYAIKQSELKPTLLKALRDAMREYPNCQWFAIWLFPGTDGKAAFIDAGHATYSDGEVVIYYGVPDPAKNLDALKPFTQDEFLAAHNISIEFNSLRKQLQKEDDQRAGNDQRLWQKLTSTRDDRIYSKLATQWSMTPQAVKATRNHLLHYYGWAWGDETIKLVKE